MLHPLFRYTASFLGFFTACHHRSYVAVFSDLNFCLPERNVIRADRQGSKNCRKKGPTLQGTFLFNTHHHRDDVAGTLIKLPITDSDIYPLVHPLLWKNWLLLEECHYPALWLDKTQHFLPIHQMISHRPKKSIYKNERWQTSFSPPREYQSSQGPWAQRKKLWDCGIEDTQRWWEFSLGSIRLKFKDSLIFFFFAPSNAHLAPSLPLSEVTAEKFQWCPRRPRIIIQVCVCIYVSASERMIDLMCAHSLCVCVFLFMWRSCMDV